MLNSLPLWWFGEQLYCLAATTLKFTIGLFLVRITVKPYQRTIVWSVMAVSGIIGVYSFLLLLLQCQPVAYFWGRFNGNGMRGSCINTVIISRSAYAFSAVSCWSDWTFCILPGFIIWRLEMNPRTKASVLILFVLGAM